MGYEDLDEQGGYGDAHTLAATVNSAATIILGAAGIVGVLQVLYGATYFFSSAGGFAGGMNVMAGMVLVVFGVLDVLGGYAVSIILRGLAAIIRATADTAQATQDALKRLDQQHAAQKQMLAQLAVSSAKRGGT